MKKIFKWLVNIILVIFIVICIISTVLLLCTNSDGVITFKNYSLVIADDNDKYLNINKNDFLILENTEFKNLEANDIVSYTKDVNKDFPDIKFGKILGFGNNSLNKISLVVANDEGTSLEVSEESYVGKWTHKKILFWGVIFSFLLTKTGFLVGIILPLFLILIYEIFRVVISYRIDHIENNDNDKGDDNDSSNSESIIDDSVNTEIIDEKDNDDDSDNEIEIL